MVNGKNATPKTINPATVNVTPAGGVA
jgi:hypothetical protein